VRSPYFANFAFKLCELCVKAVAFAFLAVIPEGNLLLLPLLLTEELNRDP